MYDIEQVKPSHSSTQRACQYTRSYTLKKMDASICCRRHTTLKSSRWNIDRRPLSPFVTALAWRRSWSGHSFSICTNCPKCHPRSRQPILRHVGEGLFSVSDGTDDEEGNTNSEMLRSATLTLSRRSRRHSRNLDRTLIFLSMSPRHIISFSPFSSCQVLGGLLECLWIS